MKTQIQTKEVYPYPIESVWEAISDSRALAQWLMENDFQPKVGHKFKFSAKPQGGWDGQVWCEVLEVKPRQKLSYSWKTTDGKVDTVVIWDLRTVSGGTELSMQHTGFKGIKGFILSKLILGPGWRKMSRKGLPAVLDFIKKSGMNFPAERLVECQH